MALISVVRHLGAVGAICCGALALPACSELGPPGPLQLTVVVAGAQASPSAPLVMTVTATNNTTARISWGLGSSSCTLGGAVRVSGDWVPILGERICTTDTTEQALDPGATRSEAFLWYGQVRRNGRTESLAPGTYQVRGEAGSMGASRAVTITVVGAA
jgi:hypothetical protein